MSKPDRLEEFVARMVRRHTKTESDSHGYFVCEECSKHMPLKEAQPWPCSVIWELSEEGLVREDLARPDPRYLKQLLRTV